jgi:hypothetical protein
MIWPLLNALMAAPFFAVWTGVPLWLVFKHPDRGDERRTASGRARSQRAEPAEPQLVRVP